MFITATTELANFGASEPDSNTAIHPFIVRLYLNTCDFPPSLRYSNATVPLLIKISQSGDGGLLTLKQTPGQIHKKVKLRLHTLFFVPA